MGDLIKTAEFAAREAGAIIRKYAERGFKTSRKEMAHDKVTEADIQSEKKVTEVIRKRFPDHNLLGEEGEYTKTGSEYTWIIDPLDGTTNFYKGIPMYCVSIAAAKSDEIYAGVIYDPVRDELWSAERGKGARCNGTELKVSGSDKLSDSVLITGFFYDRGEDMIRNLKIIGDFFTGGILGIRRFGAAALDLCYVAAGRGEGFWEHRLNPWDFCAGKLILEEAGGKLTDWEGNLTGLEPSAIAASNGILHNDILGVIRKSG
jgi:myo-inositol-1(or 4)-monophosphatase